jgi:ABC-type antimicrobial peptide transport system permease subunit
MEPAMRDAITLDISIGLLMYATLIAVVAFIILNTLLMSVLERTREFGTLLAVGMLPGLIGQMVWIELLGLALFGCVIGFAVGAAVTLQFERHGIAFSGMDRLFAQFGLPSRFYPALTPFSALAGPGAILLSIAIGGIVPYLRVARLTAASAMRAT